MKEKKGRRYQETCGMGGTRRVGWRVLSDFEWEELDRPPNMVFSLLIPHPSFLFYYLLFTISSSLGTCLAILPCFDGCANQSRFVNQLPRFVSSNLPRSLIAPVRTHLSTYFIDPDSDSFGCSQPLRENFNFTVVAWILKHDSNLLVWKFLWLYLFIINSIAMLRHSLHVELIETETLQKKSQRYKIHHPLHASGEVWSWSFHSSLQKSRAPGLMGNHYNHSEMFSH